MADLRSRLVQVSGDGGSPGGEITRQECLRLLAGQAVGRVAVAEFNQAPLVVPVNFLLDGDSIVFRTDYGSKFRVSVLGEAPVSFEVDEVDPAHRSGWSVLVRGSARELDDEDVKRLELDAWAPGRKDHWVRIVPASISGRRVALAPPPA